MWTKHSYRNFKRYIDYFDHSHSIFGKLETMPTIVSFRKVLKLKQEIRKCENKQHILLHTGDCSQPFQHVENAILNHKINFFGQIKQLIQSIHKKPATIIGRIAGQYAKPRSNEFMMHNGKQIHSYKGDIVNSLDHENRQPDSNRLMQGYINSTITHNFINNNMEDLFVSHEGLILPFQASLTREIQQKFYCLSAHMIWIGQRTRQLDGGHIQFFRGLQNPIGVKISNKITGDQFLKIAQKLNPHNQQGKLLMIIRMGHKNIGQKLKELIDIKLKHNLNFLFVNDPMHGNTLQSSCKKYKIRHFDHIYNEIQAFQTKMKESNLPFGISLQSSHEQVTECIGGAHPFHQNQIQQQLYKSKCDPRLNGQQLFELIKKINF